MRQNQGSKSGQATVETLVILILISGLISGFLLYIYKASIALWTEYHLNQALQCENSKVLQTRRYLNQKKNTQSRNKTTETERNQKKSHRKNRNCLANAKADIQKIVPWYKVIVRRIDTSKEYEVVFKWDEERKVQFNSKELNVQKHLSKPHNLDF